MTESQVVITVRSDSHPALAFISGGGGGHEPLDSGFVAPGMLHACVTGPRFTSPSAP
ncbi:MAG: dihydroxyacetone kinase subunit DhaK, partial [Actinomyces sp.]|nr:dihydroxyacetone kinase subunit DhaK [Actinomyces sp.]